jgi:hypothetical protein
VQNYKPSVLLVKFIDSERKSKCANDRSLRVAKHCEALNKNILAFSMRCTPHFVDGQVRMDEFLQDPGMYYNSASTYCHFMRFKIFLEEVSTLRIPPCRDEKPNVPPGCILAIDRSALQMIGYLGELIAAELYISTPFTPRVLVGRSTEEGSYEFVEVPMFIVRSGAGLERMAVSVLHNGDLYYTKLRRH